MEKLRDLSSHEKHVILPVAERLQRLREAVAYTERELKTALNVALPGFEDPDVVFKDGAFHRIAHDTNEE